MNWKYRIDKAHKIGGLDTQKSPFFGCSFVGFSVTAHELMVPA